MTSDALPTRLNGAWVASILLLHLAVLGFGPMAVEAVGVTGAVVLVLPLGLAIIPHWALIHEAIHGRLHPSAATNRLLGRALSIAFLAPFDSLRFGHLLHHAENPSGGDRPDLFDRRRASPWKAALVYYPRLLIGLYLAEVASGPLAWLPRRWLAPLLARLPGDGAGRGIRQLLEPARLRRIRVDALLIIGLIGLCGWLWQGALLPLGLFLLWRGVLVSLLDNAAHYGCRIGDPAEGCDMRAPRLVAAWALNSHLHGTHHRHPNAPWTALPALFRDDARSPDGAYLVRPWRQFAGPIARDRLTG